MTAAKKRAYHHGDLRRALIDAATELASTGGPESVVLREAARRVGVSATAAYRHFDNRGELLQAVCDERAEPSLTAATQRKLKAVRLTGDATADALARLEAAGRGYLTFAFAHPGLFRVIFTHREKERIGPPPYGEEETSFGILGGLLDELVECGYLPKEERAYAEIAAWSVVHGMAMLVLDGPLAYLPTRERNAAITRVFMMALRGLEGQ